MLNPFKSTIATYARMLSRLSVKEQANLFVPPSKTPSLPTEGNYRKHDFCVWCPVPIPSHHTAVRAFSSRDSRLAWPEVVGRAPPTIKDPRASCCAFPSPQWSGEEQDDQVSLSSKCPPKKISPILRPLTSGSCCRGLCRP